MPTKLTTAPNVEPNAPKRRATTLPTPFTNGQQAILQLLNRPLTDEQLHDIQKLIGAYLANQTNTLARQVWQEKGYSQADMDALLTTHVRTPYQKQ